MRSHGIIAVALFGLSASVSFGQTASAAAANGPYKVINSAKVGGDGGFDYVTADPDTSPITLADAAQRPLLVSGPNSSSRRIVQRIFDERGLSATWIGEIDTVSALRCAIASGVGNSILPSCNVYDDQQKPVLNLRRFADAELVRPVALCFSEVGQRSPAIEAVALTLKSLVRELVESGTWQGVSLIADPAELSASLVPP